MSNTTEIKFDEEYYEQHEIHKQWFAAWDRGDRQEAKRLRRKIKIRAESLMATKKLFGADYIRREGLNTEDADRKSGPDWLDKDDGPPTLAHRVAGKCKSFSKPDEDTGDYHVDK